MNFKYGIDGHQRSTGTVVEFFGGKGFMTSEAYEDRVMIRDEEFMRPVGPYYIPIDGISSALSNGDVVEFLAVETTFGVMALRARRVGTITEKCEYGKVLNENWNDWVFPRLIGCVQGYNKVSAYGFIKSDEVLRNSFFHKCELLVPYEDSASPRAIDRDIPKGALVTFDSAETPKGMRAFAVRRLNKEN